MNRLNSITSVGRYKKDEIVKKEMYKLLGANPEGIGSKEFVEKIRATTKVSRGKILSMIKRYVQLGIMKTERDLEDKHHATYFPDLQKARATHDPYHAKQLLGRKSLKSTEIYINVE